MLLIELLCGLLQVWSFFLKVPMNVFSPSETKKNTSQRCIRTGHVCVSVAPLRICTKSRVGVGSFSEEDSTPQEDQSKDPVIVTVDTSI